MMLMDFSWSRNRRIWPECRAWPPCLWQRRRQFPESPKHPIDCPTGLAEPCWYPGPPIPPTPHAIQRCSLSLFLSSVFYPRPPSAAALGMANTPPCRVYVSGMRPPPPLFCPHPPFPRSCHAWCQPVWPPTHTTFSSFPPLTSLSPFSCLSFSLFPRLSFPPFFLFLSQALPPPLHQALFFPLFPTFSFFFPTFPCFPDFNLSLTLFSTFGHSDPVSPSLIRACEGGTYCLMRLRFISTSPFSLFFPVSSQETIYTTIDYIDSFSFSLISSSTGITHPSTPLVKQTEIVWITCRHSPGRGRDKLRRFQKCRGTVHLLPQPSQSRPATKIEKKTTNVLRI